MTEALIDLPDVEQLSPRVIRILGQNPGKFTLQGTNTYLISAPPKQDDTKSIPTILVDVAEGHDDYIGSLRSVLLGEHKGVAVKQRRHITHIFLSHWHHDHVQGLPVVLQELTKLRKEGRLEGCPPSICKLSNPDQDPDIESSIADLVPGTDFTSAGSNVLGYLQDEQCFDVGGATTLRLLLTPGHTTDHLSFLLEEEGTFFSGDNVLGQGTSVFEDLGAYLSSLQRSADILESQREKAGGGQIYPGHGPAIVDGKPAIEMYMRHRLDREKQIVELLTQPSPSKRTDDGTGTAVWSITDVVKELYASYPESLYPAAARGIFLHLHKLGDEGKVKCFGDEASSDGRPPPVRPLKAEYMQLEWALSARGKL